MRGWEGEQNDEAERKGRGGPVHGLVSVGGLVGRKCERKSRLDRSGVL